MELIIAVLLFLGVITSPDQVTAENYQQYESSVTEEDIELYRQTEPTEDDY